jgi:AcrR family transcriptional regulator
MEVVARSDAQRSIDAILTAARDVLAQDAAAGLTTIAERAGVHRATLYRHFPTREDLIAELHEAYLADAAAAVLETDAEADDLWAELEAATRRIYEVHISWRAYAWAPPYSAQTRAQQPELVALLSTLFGGLQRQGLVRQNLSVLELCVAWGAPVQFLAARVDEGDWTLDGVVDYTLRLIGPG